MRHGIWLFAVLAAPVAAQEPKKPDYPPSRVENVVDTLHGVKVSDPYRWLEDGASPEVKAWTEKQNQFTQAYLDKLPPRKQLTERLEKLLDMGTLTVVVPRKGWHFHTKREGNQNQAVLYRQHGLGSEKSVEVDPNALAKDGTTTLDWYFPSPSGEYVAYGLSEHGDEQSILRISRRMATEPLADKIPLTRACSVAWLPNDRGFYYTRYPKPGSVPKGEETYHRRVYFHELGTDPEKDELVFGNDLQMTDWPNVFLSPDGRWLVVEVEKGWAQNEVWFLDREAKEKKWVALAKDAKALYKVSPQKGVIYLRTNDGAPNYRLFAVDPLKPERKEWKEIIPESEDVLEGFGYAGGKLVCNYMRKATSKLKLFDADGKFDRDIPVPGVGSVTGMAGESTNSNFFFAFHSFTAPTAVYRYNVGGYPAEAEKPQVVEQLKSDIDFSQYEVTQVRYPSKDGTEVTMFLAGKKGLKRDGKTPTLLWAYGGFNINITPNFLAHRFAFLEKGGLLAVPNLRGGGEYGEKWHEAGMLGKKQNVFDDYIAAAEYLINEKYTAPEFLCAEGRSNGGLLMGAVMTQRPELFKAVVCGVPLLDMVRYHRFLIAKLWIPEYGDPEEKDEFPWLYAYSPYHRVRDGTKYPATLITTAESDTRVDPLHARKMAARLQAATGSDSPILLRVDTKAGHGVGKPRSKQVEELVDTWSFVFEQLGMK
jgi:prolyl oligopeptidase